MLYLRSLCLFAHDGVPHILCCGLYFVCLRRVIHCCQFLWTVKFLIAPSVFSNVYL